MLIFDHLGPAPPPTAQVTVRNYVRRLRRAMPDPVVDTIPPGHRLGIQPEQLDVHRFERRLDQASAGCAAWNGRSSART